MFTEGGLVLWLQKVVWSYVYRRWSGPMLKEGGLVLCLQKVVWSYVSCACTSLFLGF